ncbi:DUF4407 domain-containing protein [Olivibacter sp. SDN3]|uniref:DUF4407 domain-containing protein n=1 Tax=Olivibacter sp. SDN3 TaxID=2764720 RepID=UPI002103D634|nr:DUF4407 domain-containing protein [Olivibacter sp. SDN3]
MPTLLESPTEQSKYLGIGATIFFTGVFAGTAAGYASYFVFSGNPYAIIVALLFGIIWGLAIFNMDRYIVLSINKNKTPLKQLLQAAPRILLAVIIGIVIARPLEIKIFDKEIKEQLKSNYLQDQQLKVETLARSFEGRYQSEIESVDELKIRRDSLQQALKGVRQQLNFEIFGNKTDETSGIIGYGSYAKRKENELKESELFYDSVLAEIALKEQFLSGQRIKEGLFDEKLIAGRSLDSAVNLAGFADRNAALEQLKYEINGTRKASNYWAITFITGLFIFFECLPVLVKLMATKGPYDVLINNMDETVIYRSDMEKKIQQVVSDRMVEKRIETEVFYQTEQLKV